MRRQSPPQFMRHTGMAAPFLRSDVEVEVIAPLSPDLHARGHTPAAGISSESDDAAHPDSRPRCFEGLRYFPDGSENPAFVLNRARYRSATILLGGENFGIGSLRGFAAYRLAECGFRSIIATSFGTVFHRDCLDYGLLPIALEWGPVERMAEWVEAHAGVPLTVDLEKNRIHASGMDAVAFTIEPRARRQLLAGTDELPEMLRHEADARSFREANRRRMPWLNPPSND